MRGRKERMNERVEHEHGYSHPAMKVSEDERFTSTPKGSMA